MLRVNQLQGFGAPRRVAAGGFTDPTDLTDSIWFDFSDASTMTESDDSAPENGDAIKTITAKGDYSTLPTFSEVSSGNGPLWDSGGFANFTGIRALIREDTFFEDGLAVLDGFCIYFLMKANPAADARFISEGRSSTTVPIYAPVQSGFTTESVDSASFIRNDANSQVLGQTSIYVNDVFDNTLQVFGHELDNDSATWEGYNETTLDGSGIFNGAVGALTTDRASIGCLYRTTTSNFFVASEVHHIVMVPRTSLTTQERSDLVAWLKTEGGL